MKSDIVALDPSLRWKEAEKKATLLQQNGQQIIWEFDLGLFSKLRFSVADEIQFKTFELVFDHFKKSLYTQFEEASSGAILYRGPWDFSQTIPWTCEEDDRFSHFLRKKSPTPFQKRLFSRDLGFEFLKILSTLLPEKLPLFLHLEGEVSNRTEFLSLIAEVSHDVFFIETELKPQKGQQAILLPHLHTIEEGFFARLENLMSQFPEAVLIPEAFLTQKWEEIDTLVFLKDTLSLQAERKIQAFKASSGKLQGF